MFRGLTTDVREPAELQQDGKIPNAINLPLSSLQESLALPDEVFHEKFDFDKPDKNKVPPKLSVVFMEGSNFLL
jgi:rhodanese-related sulfurtransferase